MADRSLLAHSHMPLFQQWLEAKNIPFRAGKGQWQALQVCKDGVHWNCVYERLQGGAIAEHYSVDKHLVPLVSGFLHDLKAGRLREQTVPATSPALTWNDIAAVISSMSEQQRADQAKFRIFYEDATEALLQLQWEHSALGSLLLGERALQD